MLETTASALSVYKVLRHDEWERMQKEPLFSGSADDERDGFIHLSTASQVEGTLERHYAGEMNLVILEFTTAALGTELRWERSRGGALFPHLYGYLRLEDVKSRSDAAHFLSASPAAP